MQKFILKISFHKEQRNTYTIKTIWFKYLISTNFQTYKHINIKTIKLESKSISFINFEKMYLLICRNELFSHQGYDQQKLVLMDLILFFSTWVSCWSFISSIFPKKLCKSKIWRSKIINVGLRPVFNSYDLNYLLNRLYIIYRLYIAS